MATRFYLHNAAAPYSPATFRGGWDSTASAVTKLLDTAKVPATAKTALDITASGTAPYSYLHYRGVTAPLAAGTIGTGTFNLCIALCEYSATTDAYWRVHIYVTQGDSDTVRGTLLNQYAENTTNELPNSVRDASSLQSAQALSSVAVSAGDRIVVELGLIKRGATSSTTRFTYGCPANAQDVAVGEEAWNANRVGWVEFSETFSSGSGVYGRVSQGAAEVALDEDTAQAARVSQGAVEVAVLDPENPARITQAVAELVQAQSASLRLTQLVAELMAPSVVGSSVTQMVAELLTLTVIESRHTQTVAEIANAQIGDTRCTQFVIEMLAKVSSYCGTPALSPSPLCGKPDVLAWMEWTVPMREN